MTLQITQTPPTDEQKKAAYADAIIQTTLQARGQIIQNMTHVQKLIQANPDGYSKEDLYATIDAKYGEGAMATLHDIEAKALELITLIEVVE